MICPECGANNTSTSFRCESCQSVLGGRPTLASRADSAMSFVYYGLGLVLLWAGIFLMFGAVYGLLTNISLSSLFLFPIPMIMIVGGYRLWQSNK